MKKSELIKSLADKQKHISIKDVDDCVNSILKHIAGALSNGERIEIRGFGSFLLMKRQARIGRNPKTGERVSIPEKHVPYFKPGKILKDNLNAKYR